MRLIFALASPVRQPSEPPNPAIQSEIILWKRPGSTKRLLDRAACAYPYVQREVQMSFDASIFAALQGAIKVAYALTLCWGGISDVRRLQLPNSVSIAVVILFFLNYALESNPERLTPHLAVAATAFILTLGLYAAGLMGAGDVKLIAALALWGGVKDGITFVLIMTLIGGLLAGALLLLRHVLVLWPAIGRYIPSRRVKAWASRGIFPYGLAICAAGLILLPSFFERPA
jgi:prepilin peptidase CpaA